MARIFKYIILCDGKYSIKKKDFSHPVKKIEKRFHLENLKISYHSIVSLVDALKENNIDIAELFIKEGSLWILKNNEDFEKELQEFELKNKEYDEEREYMIRYNREIGNKSLESIINKKKETMSLLSEQIKNLENKLKQSDE